MTSEVKVWGIYMTDEREVKLVDAEDYLAIQEALREALDGWQHAEDEPSDYVRIDELRAEFLGGK